MDGPSPSGSRVRLDVDLMFGGYQLQMVAALGYSYVTFKLPL